VVLGTAGETDGDFDTKETKVVVEVQWILTVCFYN
jgi:hypothetical protein